MRRALGLAVVGLTLAGCQDGGSGARAPATVAAPAGSRSVILITLDTTRRDRLGLYGYAGLTSPHLDRLATTATAFDRAYAAAAVTPVSHATILTGRHPYSHGLRVLHGKTENRLADEEITLAEILGAQGWATAAFVSAFPAGSRFGLHQGFATFDEDYGQAATDAVDSDTGIVNTGSNQRVAGDTTEQARRWLEQAPSPYFMWVHYFDPHDAHLLPPDDYLERFNPPSGALTDRLRAIYDVEIRYMDEQLGRLLAAVAARPDGETAVIAVTSDHGEGLGDHDWWTHGLLYEEQIHVPLVVRAPGLPTGARSDRLTGAVDVMPTLLDAAGAAIPPELGLDGISLVRPNPVATADDAAVYADSINMLTYRMVEELTDEKDDMLFAVIAGHWKYIHHLIRPEESELYNLRDDPDELDNRIGERPDLTAVLLENLRRRDFRPKESTGREGMSAEDLERLRSLGYAD